MLDTFVNTRAVKRLQLIGTIRSSARGWRERGPSTIRTFRKVAMNDTADIVMRNGWYYLYTTAEAVAAMPRGPNRLRFVSEKPAVVMPFLLRAKPTASGTAGGKGTDRRPRAR